MENKEQLNPKAKTNQAGEENLTRKTAGEEKKEQQPGPENPKDGDTSSIRQDNDKKSTMTQSASEQSSAEQPGDAKSASEETTSDQQPEKDSPAPGQTANDTAGESKPAAGQAVEERPDDPVTNTEQAREDLAEEAETRAEQPIDNKSEENKTAAGQTGEKDQEESTSVAEQPRVDQPHETTPAAEKSAEDKPEAKKAVAEEAPEDQLKEPAPKTEQPRKDISQEDKDTAQQPADSQTEGTETISEKQTDDNQEAITEEKQEEDQEEEDSDALAERYAAMNRDELVGSAEQLVNHEDVNYIRKHIGFIKASYRKLLRDENMAAYEQRLGKEDSTEESETPADELTQRFDAAFAIYKDKKAAHDKALEKEMQDNLGAKEQILEELRELIDSEEELKRTYDHFHSLQERWRSVGPVPRSSKGTLWNNYHFLVEKFFDKVNINKELKDLDLKKNLEAKTDLCEKAEELLLETSVTSSFQKLQKLHEAWKETGPVPKDKKDELWDRFKAATDKLNKRRQEHYESLREEQNKNYAAKLVLCEKAEELIENLPETPRQWQQRTVEVNELFKVWKTIGFAPKKVNNEVWSRFRTSLDTFFSSKKEFFKKYKDQQKENYNQKINLCLQAEKLKDSEDWRATTESLIALQKEWKQIGPVPAKFSDKIWKRFREACDTFFNRKADHFANIGEKQEENLKKKQELIEKIKHHDYSDDNKENLETLKDFQRQWMDIGHVPIKLKDKIQAEFRKAIDEQFEKLKLNKKVKSTLSFRSKIENLKGAPNAGNIIQKEKNILANKIKNLEGDIKVLENNIGFFASSKKADVLKAEFEDKIEKARNEISVLKEKMKILSDS